MLLGLAFAARAPAALRTTVTNLSPVKDERTFALISRQPVDRHEASLMPAGDFDADRASCAIDFLYGFEQRVHWSERHQVSVERRDWLPATEGEALPIAKAASVPLVSATAETLPLL